MKITVLASGGLDSTSIIYWLTQKGFEVEPLFVNYGQHCAETEYNTLQAVLPKRLATRIKVVDVSTIYEGSTSRLIKETDLWRDSISHHDLYLPYRNVLLLSIGAAFCQDSGSRDLCAGFINSNHASEIDCSSKFFRQVGVLMREYGGVKVRMPFRRFSKKQVAKLAVKLGVPIGETFSCQVNREIPCGACPNCVERLDAINSL